MFLRTRTLVLRSRFLEHTPRRQFDAMTARSTTKRAAPAGSSPLRRSSRVAGSLSRFRYDGGVKKKEVLSADEDEEKADVDPDTDADADSSFSDDLSFHSDIEDAVLAPRQRATKKGNQTRRTGPTAAAAATSTSTGSKRKRPATTTTTVSDSTAAGLSIRKRRVGTDDDAHALLAATKTGIKAEEDDEAEESRPATKPRKVRKPARVITATRVKTEAGEEETGQKGAPPVAHVEPPTDWEVMYNMVKAMRQPGGPAANAAVDTMGCERLALASASPRDRRFHTLVALMLSSQTKDTVNAVAMARLQAELPPHKPGAPPGLNLENMLAVDPVLLNQLIYQVGFHNNKTKYLKQAAVILRDQFDGDIPPTAAGLMSLPGVGPKMAYLCLAAEHGWNRVEGIGVDVHVHRITNLWGWQKPGSPAAKTPEGTRLALQSWLPRDKWKEINWLLVGFGQSVCLPQGARCGDCTLGLRGLCRAANRKKVAEGRKRLSQADQDALDVKEDEFVIKKEEDA